MENEQIIIESIYRLEPREVIEESVIAVVASANSQVPDSRKLERIYMYQALERAMDRTALLFNKPEVREIKVMREVSDFVKVATFGSEPKYCQDYLDLLPVGHPLSKRQTELAVDDIIEHKILWISGDPRVAEEHRPLVASAFRTEPNSVERKFLVARLENMPSTEMPKDLVLKLID